ncbi:sensor histidine kinase [Solwaraspora sp. WMMA2080]|uniref:sensor histidine kinase n=1 Tax=unclassified Solwaraspora TaxID=2627926 RepID=UPI00248AF4AF|nr:MULTISPECIES: sensor histidine kinase [unclassified Solwaraspora]WBB99477.1 sensor histidine kinase [Solwaraspora sp. WMMA2059]WBC21973.1 sensor histidine kinase [Solwaraspora sp. WMMA2080]
MEPTEPDRSTGPHGSRWWRWWWRWWRTARGAGTTGPVPPVLARDGLLAATVVGVDLALQALGPTGQPGPNLGWQAVVGWSLIAAAPIAARRVVVWPAVLASAAMVAVPLLTGHEPVSMALALVILTYTAACWLALRPAVVATAVLWLPVLTVNAALPQGAEMPGISRLYLLFVNGLTMLVAFFIGRTVHARRSATRTLAERARVAEENQRAAADQAVADERRRIARELHDVVAHHVSVMGVLATGARRVLHRDPAAADEALGTIADTSRSTLREMRRLLDVLRTDAEPADAELTPQPGLGGIESLVEQIREAGLPVTLRIDGVPGDLDPGVTLTLYRIVQEALTNALKHAGAATAEVRLSFGVYWLIVEVFDTGRGPGPDRGRVGHGLVGMRERVALYGGTLRTGPRPGGGFRIYAKLPMEQLGAATRQGAP